MRLILIAALLALFASSCTINKDIMFKTDRDFVFDVPDTSAQDSSYRLAPNDILTFDLYSNDGSRLLEITALSGNQLVGGQRINVVRYFVEQDGMVDLPEIGRVKLAGLTMVEAQLFLEGEYAALYTNPYAVLRVINNRVIVYPGGGGDAQVISLANQNTNVVEALALAGGLNRRGNASKVKLFRLNRESKEYDVYLMDLSTIEGIQYATMPVQANDILYVEPVPEIAREIFQDIAPVVSIFTSMGLLIALLRAQV